METFVEMHLIVGLLSGYRLKTGKYLSGDRVVPVKL